MAPKPTNKEHPLLARNATSATGRSISFATMISGATLTRLPPTTYMRPCPRCRSKVVGDQYRVTLEPPSAVGWTAAVHPYGGHPAADLAIAHMKGSIPAARRLEHGRAGSRRPPAGTATDALRRRSACWGNLGRRHVGVPLVAGMPLRPIGGQGNRHGDVIMLPDALVDIFSSRRFPQLQVP
jgi:hypothetical protein